MSKTNLTIEYILKAANNMEFDNSDTYISRILFEHYNKIPTYTLENIVTVLNVSKPKFKTYLNQLGCKNYTSFKDEVIFERIIRIKQIKDRYELFEKDKIIKIMNQFRKQPIDMNKVDKICKQINEHERFIVYGSPTLLNLLFDFQVDMKIFDKTVLLSSVNDGKILVPKNNDLIGLFTATGRLLGCCDAKFQEIVLDTKNTKILFSKAQINSEYVDFNFSIHIDRCCFDK